MSEIEQNPKRLSDNEGAARKDYRAGHAWVCEDEERAIVCLPDDFDCDENTITCIGKVCDAFAAGCKYQRESRTNETRRFIDESFSATEPGEMEAHDSLILSAENESPGSLLTIALDEHEAKDIRGVAARMIVELLGAVESKTVRLGLEDGIGEWELPLKTPAGTASTSALQFDIGLREFRHINVARCEDSFAPLNSWSPTDYGCALAGETGEACNLLKKQLRDGVEIKDALSDELADAFTYLDLLAARMGIDLAKAVVHKFNKISKKVGSNFKLADLTAIENGAHE